MKGIKGSSAEPMQELLIRLERNNNIIQRLSKKINSYTCEPHDSSCFEKLYDLRQSFKAYAGQQHRIKALLRQRKSEAKNLRSDILLQLERFKQLEKDIAAYILATNQYS